MSAASAARGLQARAASSEHGSPRKSARQSKGLCPKCNQQVRARRGCMRTLTHANTLTLALATTTHATAGDDSADTSAERA